MSMGGKLLNAVAMNYFMAKIPRVGQRQTPNPLDCQPLQAVKWLTVRLPPMWLASVVHSAVRPAAPERDLAAPPVSGSADAQAEPVRGEGQPTVARGGSSIRTRTQ